MPMQVKVHMLAYGNPGETRTVRLDDFDAWARLDDSSDGRLLDYVFRYGQNDFQAQPHPSVSVGDVVELPDRWPHPTSFTKYIVRPAGFAAMEEADFDAYVGLDQRDRVFAAYGLQPTTTED